MGSKYTTKRRWVARECGPCMTAGFSYAAAAALLVAPGSAFCPSASFSSLSRTSPVSWNPVIAQARGHDARGVASLRCEVLPEGGVSPCVIKVVGVGGGGGNAVQRMTQQSIPGVEFWCLNTDAQVSPIQLKGNVIHYVHVYGKAINRHPDSIKTLQIGNDVTRGLGAGGLPDIGKRAAEESRADIMEVVAGADMVFVTAGMGGGTGSGAAPVVAEVAKEMGALTVGVVTKPFAFEGQRRMYQAVGAIAELRNAVDTLIIVANDKLLEIIPPNTALERAFSVADDILRQGVVGISEIIVRPGLINVDFADVRSVMNNAGTALMGIGRGEGKTRAEDAAAAAISSPLLEAPIDKAKGIVFNIVGGNDMTLQEINAAAEVIYSNVDPAANIIFGALVDDRLQGEISITVLATGFQTADELEIPPRGQPGQQQGQGMPAGYGGRPPIQQQPQQQMQPPGGLPPNYRQQPPRRPPPPPQYGNEYPPGPGQAPTPPPPGGANNPADIPDFLTRLRRSSQR